jgi:hypothetical protein
MDFEKVLGFFRSLHDEGVSIIVATPKTLYDMKRGGLRLQDRADAASLKEEFDLGD